MPLRDMRWTGEQAAAITAEGHILLAASAGTGKTTTVVGRIGWLLGLDVGSLRASGAPLPPCPPARRCELGQIAAITFTEKAAHDLRKKLLAEIEASERPELRWEIDRAAIGTIHAFAAELLREHALRFGIDASFRILDERESRVAQEDVIRDVLFAALEAADEDAAALVSRRGLGARGRTRGAIDYIREVVRDLRWRPERYVAWSEGEALTGDRIRALSSEWGEPDELSLRECASLFRLATRSHRAWSRSMAEENVRDYDSLILDTRANLTGPAAAAALRGIRERYRVLIVDEFQDTDAAQRDIAFAIAGLPRGLGAPVPEAVATAGGPLPQLFLVGDPKQSIYRFRGADIAVWNEVRDVTCAGSEPLRLTHNFRSEPAVIRFVNRVGREALDRTAASLATLVPGSVVRHQELSATRDDGVGTVEWLAGEGASADERRETEAGLVASRIRQLVGEAEVVDPESGNRRRCEYRDCAILYRSRTGREYYEAGLRRYSIPFYVAGGGGFNHRQEVLDLLNALRVVDNPADDLRAFAFLRSPFVGLRDEVIARIRLTGGTGTMLEQARRFLSAGEWFAAPEDPRIADTEKHALREGLEALELAAELCWREPLDEAVDALLERTGYRLHLLLQAGHQEAFANIERFLRMLEEYRGLPLGSFLDIWDRWDHPDLGIPQAPLFSKDDDVVTLSSIHGAKGLEWPVVFLIDTGNTWQPALGGEYWTDPELGPLLCPPEKERGPRAVAMSLRRRLEDEAERARLLYVATTRARDRLVVAGPIREPGGLAEWLAAGRETGVRILSAVPQPEMPVHDPVVELGWLDDVEPGGLPESAHPLPEPPARFTTSATERMTRARSPVEWEQKYRFGAEPAWFFAPAARQEIPAALRGTVIHGVLERIEQEEEIARLLDETIEAVGDADVQAYLSTGSRYREALEAEIREVVRSPEWRWYIEGDSRRELPFLHLAGVREWRIGAFDLFRSAGGPSVGGGPPQPRRPPRDGGEGSQLALNLLATPGPGQGAPDGSATWIVDFKTHRIGRAEVAAKAGEYAIQAGMYREAVEAILGEAGGRVRVLFHFTHPNVAHELDIPP